MDVQTIQMDPRIAAIYYKDYRKKVREHRTDRIEGAKKLITDGNRMRRKAYSQLSQIEKEDTILMSSYREMAKGQRILNINTVLSAYGLLDTSSLPILAIAGADWKYCHIRTNSDEYVAFCRDAFPNWSWKTKRYCTPAVTVPRSVFPAELRDTYWRSQNKKPSLDRVRALVPSIPVHLRPAGDISKYHILWEAEWEHTAPIDPFLLKHVTGPIYAVVAQWDLTPLERSILEGRY